MYILFVYEDGKPSNSMGIRKDYLDELYRIAADMAKEILARNPRAKIETKVEGYI